MPKGLVFEFTFILDDKVAVQVEERPREILHPVVEFAFVIDLSLLTAQVMIRAQLFSYSLCHSKISFALD